MIVKIYNHKYIVDNNCPKEVIKELEKRSKTLEYSLYKRYILFWPNTKKYIIGNCCECGKECKNRHDKLNKRKYSKNVLLCQKCLAKDVGKHDEFIRNNSNAQLIAQNKPEMKEKMSQSLMRAWKNENLAQRWSAAISAKNKSKEGRLAISKSAKKMWQNEEYREMMLQKFIGFRGISGIFYSKFSGDIRFDSTYELFYLFFEDLNKNHIQRFGKSIKYELHGETKSYIPDFIDQNKNIIEVKSSYIKKLNGLEELNAKRNFAEQYIKENGYNDYYLLEERDLNRYENLYLRHHLLFLLFQNRHISIYHGKVKEYKAESPYIKKARELVNQWNLLKLQE